MLLKVSYLPVFEAQLTALTPLAGASVVIPATSC
jgi:hypothetical protein